MDLMHFRNFLGPPGTSLCGAPLGARVEATLSPAQVTCERCLALLGRLQAAKIAPPSADKQKE